MEIPRPKPTIVDYNRTFWEGCREHKLRIQKCVGCGHLQHPPGPICCKCRSFEHEYPELSGRGRLLSFFFIERVVHPSFASGDNVALIQLEEGVRLVSSLRGMPSEEAFEFDMAVRVDFEPIDDEITLPVFVKVNDPNAGVC